MSEFKREERYFVVKINHLTDKQLNDFEAMHLPTVECVVIESDWPNYQQTWDSIEDICSGRFIPSKIKIAELEALCKEYADTYFACKCRPSDMKAHNLEQHIHAVDCFSDQCLSGEALELSISYCENLRNQAKALKEQGE